MRKIGKIISLVIVGLGLIFCLWPTLSLAEDSNTLLPIPKENANLDCSDKNKGSLDYGQKIVCGQVALSDIPYYILWVANFMLGIIGTICVIMVIVGGYQYIFAGFNDAKKGAGKKTITNALVGLVIALLSWVIVNVIQVNIIAS
ncbi:hypothetical protein COT40_00415 [Candidatus Peregrinibacteria bacterium CG08_land_8_20_14_0_20_41_10]|nr:MAG: hypothetical protein COT40_00415 [Candidatus Peregrinibacteria bacterium CG08_land_8_20_14_0_20_41_10]